jgi:class 3 adenylate cyclase
VTDQARQRPRVRLPVRTFLVIGFGGLMLLAVAGVLYLGYTSARDVTFELLRDVAAGMIASTARNMETELEPVVAQAAGIADAIASGRLSLDDSARLDPFIEGSLAATPEVMVLAIATADYKGRIYRSRKHEVSDVDWSHNPDVIGVVDALAGSAGSTWGAPLQQGPEQQTVLNLRTPLFRDGHYLGGLWQGVAISDLSQALSSGSGVEELTPFVLYDKRWVLAHPLHSGMDEMVSPGEPLPTLTSFGDGVLAQIWSPTGEALDLLEKTSNIKGVSVPIGGRDYIFLYREINRYADKPLTVGVYFEAGTKGEDELARLNKMVVFGVVILAVAVIAALFVGRMIGRPILRLAAAAGKIRHGDLDDFEPLPRTALGEIDDASRSFNAMVQGLRERNLVRGLLGKYVPESVAAKLIKDRGAIEPVSTQATVMFTDVAGFTSLSEKVSPEALVEMLNEYFTVLADILETHGGVITQFQGDGLLAVFNVPVPDPDHAAEAVRSAVEMQRAIAGRTFAGHTLTSRIGITTGEVVAGSVGTGGRLSYTIYGDTVNLASRLEQMNKQFGTGILVSSKTVGLAGDFPFERIGEVEVRGKAEPVTVYTVTAETAAGP